MGDLTSDEIRDIGIRAVENGDSGVLEVCRAALGMTSRWKQPLGARRLTTPEERAEACAELARVRHARTKTPAEEPGR